LTEYVIPTYNIAIMQCLFGLAVGTQI